MTGTEKIKAKILEDAQKRSDGILEQAAEEARKITQKAEKEASEKTQAMLQRAELDGTEVYRRLLAVSGLEARKEVLRAKQDMVNAAFNTAMENVSNLPDKQYQKLLEDMVVRMNHKGTAEMLLSEKDLKRIDKQFVTNINKGLKALGSEAAVRLSKETIKTKGGFVLKCGDMEVNSTFEILFGILRPELESDVVKILFDS